MSTPVTPTAARPGAVRTRLRRAASVTMAAGLVPVVLAWVSVPVAGGHQVDVALIATGCGCSPPRCSG